jgi:hypothetical protein
VDLENPFAVLPLDVLANKLKRDAVEMMLLSTHVATLVDAAAEPEAVMATTSSREDAVSSV